MTKAKKIQLIFTLLTAGFALFIFSNSLQPATISGAKSGSIVTLLNNALASVGIKLTISDHLVRKTGHFTEYFALGVLLLATLKTYTPRLIKNIFAPLFCGLAVAVTDESIQLFVDGRSGQVSDVVLDFCGVLTGLLVLGLLLKLHMHKIKTKI